MHFIIIVSVSLSINLESVSANGVELLSVKSVGQSVCVSLSVCVSGKCIVAKRLI